MRSNLFWLSDEQWERIEPHLPTDVRGVERQDDRRVISGIVRLPARIWPAYDHLQSLRTLGATRYLGKPVPQNLPGTDDPQTRR